MHFGSAIDDHNHGKESCDHTQKEIIRAEGQRAGKHDDRDDQKDRIETLGKGPELLRHEVKEH